MVTPFYIKFDQVFDDGVIAEPVRRGISREQRSERIAASAERSAGIRRGRMRLAKAVEAVNNGETSLGVLRLKAGLSQAELGNLIGMKQPNVARFEKKPGNPEFETLKKLAAALKVSLDVIFQAIDTTNRLAENEAVA